MAQAMPRYCPRCGTPTWADMQRCATCDLPVEAMLSRSGNIQSRTGDQNDAASQGAAVPTPRQMQHGDQQYYPPMSPRPQAFQPNWNSSGEPAQPPRFSPASPMPPGPGEWNASNNPGSQPWPAQAETHFAPTQLPNADAWNAPNYPPNNPASQAPWTAQAEPMSPPPQAPRLRSRSRAGIIFVVLVILLVLAGGGYFAFSALGGHIPGMGTSQAPIKTTRLNQTVTYAGVDITLVNAQQAQNFVDDPQTASNGMLRLNLQEQNKTSQSTSWDYNQNARLIIPGKAPLAPIYVKAKGSIAPGATQNSVIDFTVANSGDLSKMVFQLGSAKEAQMQIPLTGQANLSQYQQKTTKQNGTMTYFGLNWTLTSSTTSLSIAGQQASHGMEFLFLNLTVDNTLSQEAISGSPFEYMRVKASGQTVAPISTTLPVSFKTGDTGKTGTATFLIPQNSTSCTLVMLSQDPGGSGQASVNFQVG